MGMGRIALLCDPSSVQVAPDGSTEVKIRFACSLTLAGKSAGHIVGEIKLTWNPEPLPDKLSAAIKDLSSLVQVESRGLFDAITLAVVAFVASDPSHSVIAHFVDDISCRM